MSKKKTANKTKKEEIREELKSGRRVNLFEEAFSLPEVETLMEGLDEDEMVQVRKGVVPIIHTWQGVLNMIADAMDDPQQQQKIKEEFEKRFSQK